jgi:hypothetical protein
MKSAETIEQMPSSVKAQLSALKSLVDELSRAQKLLWHSWGDHDAKWFEFQIGHNIVKQAIHSTTPYFTGRGIIKLELGQEVYYLVVNHSERFNSQWNKNHPQRRAYERFFPGDCIVTGHRHKPAFQVDWHYEQLREMGLRVGGKYILIAVGTFKDGPDPYSIRSWSKGVIGVPTVVFQPDRHDMDVFDSPAKAVRFLNAGGKA